MVSLEGGGLRQRSMGQWYEDCRFDDGWPEIPFSDGVLGQFYEGTQAGPTLGLTWRSRTWTLQNP